MLHKHTNIPNEINKATNSDPEGNLNEKLNLTSNMIYEP